MMPAGLIFEPAEYRGSAQQRTTFRMDVETLLGCAARNCKELSGECTAFGKDRLCDKTDGHGVNMNANYAFSCFGIHFML